MERPTLRQLEYFVALATHLNFRKAAEASFVSQPTLSGQIAQLEAMLGVTLFERHPRGAELTKAALALLPEAKRTLNSADRFVQVAESVGTPLTGPLRIGVIPTVGPYLLPKIVPAVRKAFPDLQMFLREDTTSRLLQMLDIGDLDLLLLAIDIDLGNVAKLALFSDPFVVAVACDHEWGTLDSIDLENLLERDMLLLDEGHCLRDQILPLCKGENGDEPIGFRATSLATITQMVASGLGITLLPELAIEREASATQNLHLIHFGADGPCRSIGLAWRKSSTRADEFESLGQVMAQAYAAS
jgi:LysR family transcriptional regulator, hydrogen peroxide-inducible genes activator